jgi:hypothetical protein
MSKQITPEQRANILGENRTHGFHAVGETAPAWVRERLTVIRTAVMENRAVPAYTPTELDAIHRRVLDQQARSVREAKDSGAHQDAALRARLAAVGEEIRLSDEDEEEVENEDEDAVSSRRMRIRSLLSSLQDLLDEDDDENEEESA